MPLTTKDLKEMSVDDLKDIANTLATRLLALHELGKHDHPEYERVAGELYHVSAIIETKEPNENE